MNCFFTYASYISGRQSIFGSSLRYSIDGGPWYLYTNPVELTAGAAVEANAVRYGWVESESITGTATAN